MEELEMKMMILSGIMKNCGTDLKPIPLLKE
jgi:hypothetical protein